MAIIPRVILLLVSAMFSNTTSLLLYNTEDIEGMEAFDCIYYATDQTIPFCRRLGGWGRLQRTYADCLGGGEKWTFSKLLEHNINPWEVLSWNSSVEAADDYSHVFYNRSVMIVPDQFLCKCTREGSFGKYCEYQLLFDSTSFNKAVMIMLDSKSHHQLHQLVGSIWCYQTLLSCNYGKLCLDWRNICDGQQDCIDGLDEENCDMLEFNECENGEYRCTNGMCIDEEYWLDGKGLDREKWAIFRSI